MVSFQLCHVSRRILTFVQSRSDDGVATEQTSLLNHSTQPEQHRNRIDGFRERFFTKPSSWWYACLACLTLDDIPIVLASRLWSIALACAISNSIIMAPSLDLYTRLVCEELKPELFTGPGHPQMDDLMFKVPVPSRICREDPAVQADVAALVTGTFSLFWSTTSVFQRHSLAMDISMGVLSCLTTGFWMTVSVVICIISY